jgi:hypothetical protein
MLGIKFQHMKIFCCFLFVCFGWGIETESCYAAQAGLNSQSSCLSLPSSGITGVHHHGWFKITILRRH